MSGGGNDSRAWGMHGPAQPGDAVHGDRVLGARRCVATKDLVAQIQKVFNDLLGRRVAVGKRPLLRTSRKEGGSSDTLGPAGAMAKGSTGGRGEGWGRDGATPKTQGWGNGQGAGMGQWPG